MRDNHYDVIVVGSGMSGLTAAAYLGKSKIKTLLIEKEETCGGLLGAFNLKGHTVDKGARGIIDSGIIFPMLKQLDIPVEFVPNPIQMTLADQSMAFHDEADLDAYAGLLKTLFPSEHQAIDEILKDIKKIMGHMDVLYGIENPLFLPQPYDMAYLGKTLLPWVFRFLYHIRQAEKHMEPVDLYLARKTKNQALIDMIAQHFFAKTPTFFALSYFTLYLEYHYPKGSTQTIIDGLLKSLAQSGVTVKTKTEADHLDPQHKTLRTLSGETYTYDQLIWAADLNRLYACMAIDDVKSEPLKATLIQTRNNFLKQKGADSILSLYLLTDLDPETFAAKNGPHGFYTPSTEGLSSVPLSLIQTSSGSFSDNKAKVFAWLKDFIRVNTFEISIPALRDKSLSPQGKSALIISLLFDYDLTQHIVKMGWYDEFKAFVTQAFIRILDDGLWSDLGKHVEGSLVSSPKTIYDRTYATQGTVTGWSFANVPFPAVHQFIKVSTSVLTPVASIKQAGQFTFNPSGVPVAAMTGKLAADAVLKDLRKAKRHGN